MVSKVVVTYKRKRLFSRNDHSLLNLHSDTPKISESKTSADFHKPEGPREEYISQKKEREFKIFHEYSKDNVGENVQRCAKFDSPNCSSCSGKHATESEMLCSAFTEQKEFSISNETQTVALKQGRWSPKSDAKENSVHPDVLLEGSPGEICQIGTAGKSKAEEKSADTQKKLLCLKSGPEYEDTCGQTLLISSPPDACSGKEPDLICLQPSDRIYCSHQTKDASVCDTFTLEETNKFNQDQCSSLSKTLGAKRKLTSALITFCRRSKRNRDNAVSDIASVSGTPHAASCSVALNNEKVKLTNSFIGYEEKRPPEDIDNSCCFSSPHPATATVMHTDKQLHLPLGEAKYGPTAAAQPFQDSREEMLSLQGKACMVVQDDHHIDVRPESLSDKDGNSRRTTGDVSGKKNSLLSLDLSISPYASRDIDCNRSLDCGSDENHPPKPLEVLHDPLDSSNKLKGKMPALQLQGIKNGSLAKAVRDNRKSIVDTQPAFTGTSSKNNCIQLFPENRTDDMLQLANESEKVSHFRPSSSLQSSNSRGLSLQLEQIVDCCAFHTPLYQWPNVQIPPRESCHDFLQSTSDRTPSFSRQKMMLDNILTRARAVRGNRSSFLDRFEYPTTWSEEELDCLWIGMRRHGRGNWDAILRDRRLHFSSWKTPWDLAEKWQEEQSQLLRSMPVSQLKYASPLDFSSDQVTSLQQPLAQGPVEEIQVQLSLGDVQKRPPLHFMNNKKNRQLQRPAANSGTLSSYSYLTNGCCGLCSSSDSKAILGDESSSNAGPMKGSLPHWLRAAVEIPPRPSDPTHAVVPSVWHSRIGWIHQANPECPGNSQQPWLNNGCSSALRTGPYNGAKSACSNSVMQSGKTQPNEHPANKQDDLIIIPSDASSEETISDEHSIKP